MFGGERGVAEAEVDPAEEAVGFGELGRKGNGLAKRFSGARPVLLLGESAAEEVVEVGEALVGGRGGLQQREDFRDAAFAIEELAESEEGVGFGDRGGIALTEFESGAEGGFGGGAAEGVEGLAAGGGDAPG